MRFILLLTQLVCLFTSLDSTAQIKWPFHQNFSTAQEKAELDQKKLYVHFTASWCMPCTWMAEHTYQNEEVLRKLQSCIPVSIDIETTEGKLLQKEFEIEILPTLMIIDSKGMVIDKVEKSLSSVELNKWLDKVLKPKGDIPYFIQLGNYNEYETAILAKNKLQLKIKEELEIVVNNSSYQLQIGGFQTKQQAEIKLDQIQNLGIQGWIKSF